VNSNDFDKIEALHSHQKILCQQIDQYQQLVNTIEKTIARLQGKITMNDEELYDGFDAEKQKQYEKELVDKGYVTEQEMDGYRNIYKKYTKEDWERFMREGEQMNQEIVTAMKKQLSASSAEVQAIVRRHHTWVVWKPTREKYIGLSQLYQTPEFRKFYDRYGPEMVEFLAAAMRIFAERELN